MNFIPVIYFVIFKVCKLLFFPSETKSHLKLTIYLLTNIKMQQTAKGFHDGCPCRTLTEYNTDEIGGLGLTIDAATCEMTASSCWLSAALCLIPVFLILTREKIYHTWHFERYGWLHYINFICPSVVAFRCVAAWSHKVSHVISVIYILFYVM